MIKDLESQKEKIKEKLSKSIDEYYEEFSRCSDQKDFTIDQIEELMLGQQKKIRESLSESNSELTSSIQTDAKKNALSAEVTLDEPKKTKK